MEVETDSNVHYTIQTLDENEEENEIILENNTVVICSENGEQTQYFPYAIENGQIILRRLDDTSTKRLENYEPVEELIEKSPIKENNCHGTVPRQENNRIYSNPIQERRKMSYETEFKPCSLPPNRGGMKGLIRYGRKHLIIDQQIMITPREFKTQLNSTEDIIMKPELAPCTKQQMRHMLTGITRLFAYPAHKMPNTKLLQLYVSNCTTRKQPNLEMTTDMNLLPVGYKVEVDKSKIKRITRKRRYPEAEEYLRQQNLLNHDEMSEQTDDIQQLLEAANTASTDHGYTNKIENQQNVLIEPKYEVEENKKEDQIYIMQSVDENGTQSSIEVLLAAAAETSDEDELTTQYHQIQHVKSEDDEDGYQRIYIVQQGTDEVIYVPTEYVLP